MASENFVSYSIMMALKKEQWAVPHYHPPGGQAAWGIYVSEELVYLDILAYKEGTVLLVENKAKFSRKDIEKLRRIISDKSAIEQVKEFVSSRYEVDRVNVGLQFCLVHGYSGTVVSDSLPDVNLIYVHEDGSLTVTASHINPLVI
ncbi:MAG TPA: hypothetical protein VJ842_05145 [Pyrinomonadaceae bacterium]|nr:hypothetical protein [Pyrinomonadaceae bacterium]